MTNVLYHLPCPERVQLRHKRHGIQGQSIVRPEPSENILTDTPGSFCLAIRPGCDVLKYYDDIVLFGLFIG